MKKISLIFPLLLFSLTSCSLFNEPQKPEKETQEEQQEEDLPTKDEFLITYELDGGLNDESNPSTYKDSDGTVQLKPASKEGYTFLNWILEENNINELTPALVNDDITLVANWKINVYSITYYLNGGINNSDNPNSYTIDDYFILKNPTKNGYEFLGWYLNNEENITSISGSLNSNLNIYARWREIFTVNVQVEPGLNCNLIGDNYIPDGNSFQLDVSCDKGYSFAGWYNNNELISTKNSFYFYVYNDCKILGKSSLINFNIYYSNFDSLITDEYTTHFTIKDEIKVLPTPIKEGYIFQYWYCEETNSTFNPNITYYTDLHLIAVWERNTIHNLIVINSNKDAGTCDEINTNIQENEIITLNATANVSFKFIGWFDSNNNLINEANPYSFKMPTTDLTIIAKWEQLYHVTYILNGGINNENNPEYFSKNDYIHLNDPYRYGYKFLGWSDQNDYRIRAIDGSICEDIILTADWKPCEIDVNLSINIGYGYISHLSNFITGYRTGETLKVYATIDTDGVEFLGWFDTITGDKISGKRYLEIYLNGDPINYIAKFERIPNFESSSDFAFGLYPEDLEAVYLRTKYTDDRTKFICPDNIDYKGTTYKVTEIGRDAFLNDHQLKNVQLCNHIKYLNEGCFKNCTELTTINFPESLISISADTITNSLITSIDIGKNVQFISADAFSHCPLITHLTVDPNNKYFNSANDCNAIIDNYLKVWDGVNFYNEKTILYGCKNTIINSDIEGICYFFNTNAELHIPQNITYIYQEAFGNDCVIEKLYFDEGTIAIHGSEFAFYNVKEVYFPSTLIYVENNIFYSPQLEKISVAKENVTFDTNEDINGLIYLENDSALYRQGKLIIGCKTTKMPEYTSSIDRRCFKNTEVNILYITKNVEYIEEEAFYQSNINKFVVDKDNKVYDTREDCGSIIETNESRLIFASNGSLIPEGTKIIAKDSFDNTFNNLHLSSQIVLPSSLEQIETQAFYNIEVTKFIINNNLIQLDSGAVNFAAHSNVKIYIPSTVQNILMYSFSFPYEGSATIYTDASSFPSKWENFLENDYGSIVNIYYNFTLDDFLKI